MRTSAFGLAAVLILSLAIGGMALAQGVRAQSYPPPVGSLTVTAPSTTIGSITDVTATLLDNDGNPVEGAEVVFTIVSQPGTDAQWANGSLQTTAITNANGVATVLLSAGSTTGNIIVETVSGEKTSQVTIAVAAEAGGLPETGASPLKSSDDGLPAWQIALLAIGGLALAGGFMILTRRNKRA